NRRGVNEHQVTPKDFMQKTGSLWVNHVHSHPILITTRPRISFLSKFSWGCAQGRLYPEASLAIYQSSRIGKVFRCRLSYRICHTYTSPPPECPLLESGLVAVLFNSITVPTCITTPLVTPVVTWEL